MCLENSLEERVKAYNLEVRVSWDNSNFCAAHASIFSEPMHRIKNGFISIIVFLVFGKCFKY
jgi:hypothetical protein